MGSVLDHTHDPKARSWVTGANQLGCDFPLQNLPYCRFADKYGWRLGVGIGDQVLDLRAAVQEGLLLPESLQSEFLNDFMAAGARRHREVRHLLWAVLEAGSAWKARLSSCLKPQSGLMLGLPCQVGDYTDFYTSIHHATSVGKLFRPDAPLLPNYRWLPIGYHGRTSSIVPSGTPVVRPRGQSKGSDATPSWRPSVRLDYELELGFFAGAQNAQGHSIGIDEAAEAWFGVCLLNDWSARDLQAWEYQPLGPFLSKNFATTISPWVVTRDALAPFRVPIARDARDPAPLPYLNSPDDASRGALDIQLEVRLQSAEMARRGLAAVKLSRTSYRHAYWTIAQLVAHHTSNGCPLRAGDLLGTGTQSGPSPEEAGSLLELTAGGGRPIELPFGEKRVFLEDGDTVVIRGWAEDGHGRRIGLGKCVGMVQPSGSAG